VISSVAFIIFEIMTKNKNHHDILNICEIKQAVKFVNDYL